MAARKAPPTIVFRPPTSSATIPETLTAYEGGVEDALRRRCGPAERVDLPL